MKNIMKIVIALFTSASLMASASAGELTVTGSAKATYSMLHGGTQSVGTANGMGLTNEIDFGATGELDNGYTYNFQLQFDPGTASDGNKSGIDDQRLEITTPQGTVGFYIQEGGLDVDNGGSQSVYARPTDMAIASGIFDGPGIDAFNNVQLHTPAGLLPYGMSVKGAIAPGSDGRLNSGNAAGIQSKGEANHFNGDMAYQVQVKAAPVDGLNVGADYYTEEGAGNATEYVVQKAEAGSVFATYAYGPATFGISRTLRTPLILATSAKTSAAQTNSAISNTGATEGNKNSARQYTNEKYSVAYNVNDSLSVSYEREDSNQEVIANAAEFDIKAEAVQAAYTMGGMTLSVSHGTTSNIGYAQANDTTLTLFAMNMAF